MLRPTGMTHQLQALSGQNIRGVGRLSTGRSGRIAEIYAVPCVVVKNNLRVMFFMNTDS